jgi:hypothetical protein
MGARRIRVRCSVISDTLTPVMGMLPFVEWLVLGTGRRQKHVRPKRRRSWPRLGTVGGGDVCNLRVYPRHYRPAIELTDIGSDCHIRISAVLTYLIGFHVVSRAVISSCYSENTSFDTLESDMLS